jgi:PAS domain S-box-containing protein
LNRANGRLLVVDDEIEIMTSLCAILSEIGYQVVGLTRGSDALEILNRQPFDVLLADHDMPEMNGLELLESALARDRHLLGFIITGKGTVQTSVKAFEIGAVDVITKPFTLEVLRMKISRAVEVRHLRRREDMLRCIFENSPEGIYLMTPDERYIMANTAMARIFGYASSDKLIAEQEGLHKKYTEAKRRMKLMRFLKRTDSVSDFESQVSGRDNGRIWISENINAVRDTDGRVIYYTGTVSDISSRKSEGEALRESEKNLRLWADRAGRSRELCLDMIHEISDTCADLEKNLVGFLIAVSNALDGRRRCFRGHSERVAGYSLKIAHKMGIDETEQNNIRLAALCRDIGRLSLDDSLIDKPSPLTKEEYEKIKQHPVHGVNLLEGIDHFDNILPLIRHHHERVDGTGYPDGLKGQDIPVGARILHVAEAFAAMTAERPYRPVLSKEHALSELDRWKGSQFDKEIAQAAIKVLSS